MKRHAHFLYRESDKRRKMLFSLFFFRNFPLLIYDSGITKRERENSLAALSYGTS